MDFVWLWYVSVGLSIVTYRIPVENVNNRGKICMHEICKYVRNFCTFIFAVRLKLLKNFNSFKTFGFFVILISMRSVVMLSFISDIILSSFFFLVWLEFIQSYWSFQRNQLFVLLIFSIYIVFQSYWFLC